MPGNTVTIPPTTDLVIPERIINDMTEAILLKNDINVVQALPIQVGRFGGKAGNSGRDVWRGGTWAAEDLMHQRL